MAISISTGNNAVSPVGNTVRLPLPQHSTQDDSSETRLRLTQTLQTSLELSTVLNLFFEQVQTLVPMQGLRYRHTEKHCQMLVGKDSPHRVDYRLNIRQDNLGEITFSRGKRFKESEMALLESVITTLVFPLRNALQYRDAVQSALRDPLTGIGNRVAMDSALTREMQLADRHQQPLSILIIDIDHFKLINDTHGHASGDDVLREIAQGIEAISRQTDMTFRYGGEEFVVVLNKTNTEGAEIIAERIRSFVEQVRVETHKQLLQATISIGGSTLRPGETSRELFQRADEALYRAKNNGRNRVEIATR